MVILNRGRTNHLGNRFLSTSSYLWGSLLVSTGDTTQILFFSKFGLMKKGDLYKQQLRAYAWKYLKGKLPVNQASLLYKVSDTHRHNTRAAKSGLSITIQDHRSVGYRVPRDWLSLTETVRQMQFLGGFKEKSKNELINKCKLFT